MRVTAGAKLINRIGAKVLNELLLQLFKVVLEFLKEEANDSVVVGRPNDKHQPHLFESSSQRRRERSMMGCRCGCHMCMCVRFTLHCGLNSSAAFQTSSAFLE